nr:13992_t:CDS:2 [Entrophospora candida]
MLLAHKDVFSPFYITQIKTIQSPSTSETGSDESQDSIHDINRSMKSDAEIDSEIWSLMLGKQPANNLNHPFLNLPSDSTKNVMDEDTFVHKYYHLMFEEVFSMSHLKANGEPNSSKERRKSNDHKHGRKPAH